MLDDSGDGNKEVRHIQDSHSRTLSVCSCYAQSSTLLTNVLHVEFATSQRSEISCVSGFWILLTVKFCVPVLLEFAQTMLWSERLGNSCVSQ